MIVCLAQLGRSLARVLRVLLRVGVSLAATACGVRREEAPPAPPAGSGTTLELAAPHDDDDDDDDDKDGPRVVAKGQISQQWRAGSFSPETITLTDVRPGDAILVLGVYWGDLPRRSETAPTDANGTLVAAVDQGPSYVGAARPPPVFAQIYAELDAAAGRHVIAPPYLGGGPGDGTLYVLQVRGLAGAALRATGQVRILGTALPKVTVSLSTGAAQPGDFVVAIGGNDNTVQLPSSGFTDPPEGWTSAGVQNDASNNVPSEACHRVATAAGDQQVTWAWADPSVNVAVAAIATFR
jgi:hypothetical protein